MIDNLRYFPINVPNHIAFDKGEIPFQEKKLCTMIAGNHINKHPFELYSKRLEFIRWFDINQPTRFDLYGRGWDRKLFYQPRILRALNRIPAITQSLALHYACYRGPIEKKRDILHQYKFSICFENAHSFPNYITEKIFDSFNAGCVPIYWGALNITERVPKNCFIDFRDYQDYAKVYDRISTMTESDHTAYLHNIEAFLSSQKSYEFSNEYYAKTVSDTILTLYSSLEKRLSEKNEEN